MMTLSHSNEILSRLESIERHVLRLSTLIERGDYNANAPMYSIRQTSFEVGVSPYVLKKLYKTQKLDVKPPTHGVRYSKRDIAKFREAYVKYKSHA